jgi:uncharacterized protein
MNMQRQGRLKLISVLTMLVVSALMSACSGGGSAIRYYVIDPVTTSNSSISFSEELTIEIMDVHIPQYLERFNIVTRSSENQLLFNEFHQWGDNFRKNLLRTLASNLSSSLGTNDIGTPVNRTMSVADFRIQVHIEQFERNYDGYVKLLARWQVFTVGSSDPINTFKSELISSNSYEIDDYENIVYAMKDLYSQLSSLIAESINQQQKENG